MDSIEKSTKWWSLTKWKNVDMLCHKLQESFERQGIWDKTFSYPIGSYSSSALSTMSLIMCISTATIFLLKPLRLPFISQMIGGILIIGLLLQNLKLQNQLLLHQMVTYILKTLSFFGFMFHSFMLGVETNMTNIIIRRNMKSFVLGFSGSVLSIALSLTSTAFYSKGSGKITIKDWHAMPPGFTRLVVLNAQTFFMVTCTNLNDLGISNSQLGRLACTMSLLLDIFGMVFTFISFEVYLPLTKVGIIGLIKPIAVITYYVILFTVLRPLIIKIVSKYGDENRNLEKHHLATIVLIVVLIASVGELLEQMFAVFIFALSLPEDPLSGVLSKHLDSINSGLFFPLYCAMQGQQIDIKSFTNVSAIRVESTLIMGHLGKFLGTYGSSVAFGFAPKNALALSIIMSSKGIFDIVCLGLWRITNVLDSTEYTIATFHFLISSGALLPFVRCLYEPSTQYSTILRPSVMDTSENGTVRTLVCVHKEDNLAEIMRLIEAFDPSRTRPIPITTLQLIQQIGRASMPIMGLFDQVKSSGILGTKLARCEHIVESFFQLERRTDGYARLQHFICVASYDTMHNDICNLAYERTISLLILPFHINPCEKDKVVEGYSSQAIRTLNKMVLDKAPCAVGILIDKTKYHNNLKIMSNNRVFRVAIIYIGGIDDVEAVSYVNLFATTPRVTVKVIWLKSPTNVKTQNNNFDHDVINKFRAMVKSNERMSFKEISVKDGAETTNVMISLKDNIDLVIVGRYHDPKCGPLFGLNDGWNTEYPELGILGDLIASPDFNFSILVVQQESKAQSQLSRMED